MWFCTFNLEAPCASMAGLYACEQNGNTVVELLGWLLKGLLSPSKHSARGAPHKAKQPDWSCRR
jgi:hypothetical protein